MNIYILLASTDPNFVQQMPVFAPTDWSFEIAKWTIWLILFGLVGLALKGFGLL